MEGDAPKDNAEVGEGVVDGMGMHCEAPGKEKYPGRQGLHVSAETAPVEEEEKFAGQGVLDGRLLIGPPRQKEPAGQVTQVRLRYGK